MEEHKVLGKTNNRQQQPDEKILEQNNNSSNNSDINKNVNKTNIKNNIRNNDKIPEPLDKSSLEQRKSIVESIDTPIEPGRSPYWTHCDHCNSDIVTVTRTEMGCFAWTSATAMLSCALCCIPMLCPCCKDVGHYCPKCGSLIHRGRCVC